VIFVHGLGGDYAATWRYDQNSSWPHWLADEFPEVGVWSLEYAASPSRWGCILGFFSGDRDAGYSMALPDRAGQVLDRMVQKHLGERPLLFICHSLGGLLVKQILRKADDADDDPRKKQVAAQTRAVLFLATPHNGAELASLLDAFRTLFGTTVSIDDLRAHDAHLLDLYNWYRNHSLGLGIRTVTYYEKRPVMGVLPIVNATSSQAGVGPDAVPLDEDHLSIAKPREHDAQVCDAVRELLNDYVLVARSATLKQPQSLPVITATEPQRVIVQVETRGASDTFRVPCELPPAAEKHFGRQTELKQLTERLRAGKNSAVVGPAGMGKTALAAEAVRAVVGDAIADSPFPDGVVFLDLYTYRGLAEPVWNNLANALRGPEFRDSSPARERANEACRTRRILIIFEGGEEADGNDGRTTILELCSVFSPQNRYLLMTRLSTQAVPTESVKLTEALDSNVAAELLDSLTQGRVTGLVREQVLSLVDGHPLALTWAGNLLARDDDEPEQLVTDWQASGLLGLSDPKQAEHTLEWLFNRSVRGLDDLAKRLLAAAGLLARAPFPLGAMLAVLHDVLESAAIVRGALKTLVQRGLLRRSEESDHWQFTHVLGYRFAREETGSDPALREYLSRWLSGHLKEVSGDSFGNERALSLTRALEHAAALLRADDDQRLWFPLANDLLYHISVRLTALGRLDLVSRALGALTDWQAQFPEDKALEAYWLRERVTLLNKRGDVWREQGDLKRALSAYRESLALMRRLAKTDPSNAGWQRDLSVSHTKLGDVLREQGDRVEALAAYQQALVATKRLTETDPTNAGWQRDLTVDQERTGDMLRDQGDLAGALGAYQESLKGLQRLAEADPLNAGWQRDLSVSHNKVGNVLHDQGDLAGALIAYRESLEVIRRLAEADPSNAGWQRDLTVSQDGIGDVLRDQEDLAGALAAYRISMSVTRRLVDADASNTRWQRDLSVSQIKVGDVLRVQGDLPGALAAYQESLTGMRRLADADPSNARWQRDLSVSQTKVGDSLRDQGDPSGALVVYRESLMVRRRLVDADPLNAGWQRDLSFVLTRMSQLLEKQGDRAEALPLALESLGLDERLAALDPTNITWQKDVAVSRALVARLREEETGSR